MKNNRYIATMVGLLLMMGAGTTAYGQIVKGKVFGGGQVAQVNGQLTKVNGEAADAACSVTINSGEVYGEVFGAGEGVKLGETGYDADVAKVTGDTKVNLGPGHDGGGTAWRDVFGGGALAKVDGSTHVTMSGGHIAANLYGGGQGDDASNITSADVTGNTNVDINGGDAIWDRTSMPSNSSYKIYTFTILVSDPEDPSKKVPGSESYVYTETEYEDLTAKRKAELSDSEKFLKNEEDKTLAKGEIVYWDTNVRTNNYINETNASHKIRNGYFYDEEKKCFNIEHNIFGGGYLACTVGTYNEGVLAENTGLSKVSVTKGLLDTELVKTNQWKDSFSDDTHPHFYVFGGGYGENTKVANTDVTINIEGEYGDFTFEADEPTEQLAKPRKTVTPDDKLPVLDNTYGIPGFTVLGVLGGGHKGLVQQDTKVTVDGKTFLRRIYGGGFGDPNSTSDNTTGQVLGNTDVLVEGAHTYGDVFGGGAGVVSKTTDLDNVARVLGKTSVTIADDARIYGAVYGGGDMACVGVAEGKNKTNGNYSTPVSSASTLDTDTWSYSHSNHQSFVNLLGGNIFGEVYGGGKGVKKADAYDYTKVGRIEGNTLVHIANSVYDEENDTWNIVPEATENAIVPYVWNRIYGGCENGTVDGNTMVHTEGGMLGLNIFGGGYGDVPIDKNQTDISSGTSTASETLDQVLGKIADPETVTFANILGNTKVVIDGGSWIWNRKADIKGNITTWEDAGKKIGSSLDDFKALVAQIQQATSEEDLKKIDAVKSIDQNFFKLTSRQFSKNHNIFGGGNRACFVGTYPSDATVPDASASGLAAQPTANTGKSEVIINHSPITKIDDGSGNEINMLDHNTVAGLCWYLGINNTSHPQFSVFGAGYGANTKVGNAVVDAQPGVQLKSDGTIIEEGKYLNEDSDLAAYFDFEGQIAESWQSVTPDEKKLYYGSADGTDGTSNVFLRYRASQLAWSSGAPNFTFMDVHGGGFSGYVVNDAKVTADCQLTARNIFGAGLGAKPYGTIADQAAANNFNFGQVGRDASVFIKSGVVSLNVYGGGAGVESYYVSNEATAKTDFPNIALVKGKTNVDVYGETIKFESQSQAPSDLIERRIERTVIYGNVFGGGDVANVGLGATAQGAVEFIANDATPTTGQQRLEDGTFTSTVNVRGASIQSQVYAGGNGRLADQCSITGTSEPIVYGYKNLGAVFGNTHLIVADADKTYPYETTDQNTTAPSGVSPHIWNRLYGGCQNGTVYGNTLVEINGGSLGHNIFGGGFGDDGTNFGHSTGDDDDPTQSKNGRLSANITSADVTGHTNIFINGGEMELTSFWHPDTRTWESATIRQGQTYSPQYDADARKFKINHNIYGGGNAACVVEGSTYITMTKGMLKTTTQTVPGQTQVNFFASNEWKEVYQKVGSPHFAVFGGGYGTHTTIANNTYVTTSMNKESAIQGMTSLTPGEEYKHFLSEMSVMDLVGGGYSGKVIGNTYVNASNGVLARRVFGGGFYNTVENTHVTIGVIDCHDVFGGGLMGDVLTSTNVTVGTDTDGDYNNKDIWIHGDVYGGNDVSGYINMKLNDDGYFQENSETGGTNINIYGGNIDGNVYGAGNGDYLYALDREGHDKVTVNEHYPLNPEDANSPKFDLVYTVPMRETMPSYKAASDAAKIVNINSWRPLTNRVNIRIMGSDADDPVTIKGDVYGGGNSATVQKVYENGTTTTKTGAVNFNIGKYVNIGRVFMGCNGDKLFTASEDNAFLSDFQKLNNLQLDEEIDWATDPSNHGISTLYLPTENEQRPIIYPHLLDLYFQPVEMDIQANLKWADADEGVDPADDENDATILTNCTIGTFCCGGNRGNMNVYPATNGDKEGNVLDYLFPEGLTITDKIIGGCNNANYEWFNTEKNAKINHVGGYLLGQGHSPYPFIKLTVKNQFVPKENENNGAYQGGNVFGGCFETGTVRGDITVDVKSDMLAGKVKAKLEKSNELLASDPTYAALNVYGAGYGMESFVYGNTNILFGEGVACTAPTTDDTFNATGTSANFVYGGGQQGNVIGVTNVAIRNGHLYKSVTGGSYSGYVYGSTQTTIGYPTTYTLKAEKAGRYLLKRTDENNLDKKNVDGTPTIKQYINLIPGDIISEGVYDAIYAKYNGEGEEATAITELDKGTYFTSATQTPSDFGLTWDDINIYIDEAVYGGGYSLAQGSSVMANNTTVLKYTDEYNINDTYKSAPLADLTGGNRNGTTAGFGGNTMMLIADATTKLGETDRDHITISHQEMKEATLADGADLFGYYYKDNTNNYHYISKEGTYIYHTEHANTNLPSDASTTDDKKVYKYDGEGGIFGDGHLSYAEGFRAADLTGYGFADTYINNPKIINTFQRMDILRLTDNCFTLLGARDYATNATNKTPYSISRVGEIQMIANNIVLKSGTTLAGKGSDSKRSRNYMGLANNIHYVGAVKSSVPFSEAWRDNVGVLGTGANASKSYEDIKQTYINNYYNSSHDDHENVYVFQKRNDGTAKNMIGIASGYALKIQNVQEIYNTTSNKIDDKIYYGPIYGVVEMNLIDVRDDEGGGYVYADNVHKRTATPEPEPAPEPARKRAAAEPHPVDFLETTGNFVFPYNPAEGRYIVDDCFPTGYDNLTDEEKKNPDDVEGAEAHYWYVTGYNYYYNVHITGYTYDSSSEAISFDSDNKDDLTVLAGLKATQEVSIHSWNMRSGHPNNGEHAEYSCDLEERNYSDKPEDENVKGKYTLNVVAADSETYDEENGFWATLPLNGSATSIKRAALPDELSSDAKITFRLTDEANNTTSDYYNKHLSEPCYATLVLKAPAKKYQMVKGVKTLVDEIGYIGISEFYVKTGTDSEGKDTFAPAPAATISDNASSYTTYNTNPTYYYVNSVTHEYSPIENLDKLFTREQNVDGYIPVHQVADAEKSIPESYKEISINKTGVNNKYYYFAPRIYTYTIYLTIDYVQGPNIDGKITVENCALPGEMIRVNKKNVKIQADESFSADGYYWRIGKREKDSNGNWKFVDETPWTKDVATNNKAHGYDSYRQTEEAATGKGFFYGSNYNKTGDYLDIPAYYYMNGYGIQLGVSMNGLDQIFPVKMYDDDKLVIHNYHRMQPSVPNVNLHLAEAVARAKAEPTELAEPRIYLSNTNDLAGFVAFLDSVGTGKPIKLGAKKESTSWVPNLCEVPRYGEYAQFVVQNDMEIPAGYDVSKYGNIILKGTVHGEGHVITGLGADKALISENQGNIHNLGMASGKMAANGCTGGGKYHCCFEYNDGSDQPRKVYRMNGDVTTEYSVDDFRYGKVAYDLNQYYLDKRYVLGATDASSSAANYVENYFANGDYQYARRADEKTSDITGVTYLRTGTGDDEPNYGSNLTRHNMAHTIDKPRAVGYVAEHAATQADIDAGKAKTIGESVPESRTGNYLPLFNSAKQTEGLYLTEQMNDYIYWGQNLQATPAAYPSTIESLQLSAMTNRVYRAAGYYRDTKAEGYYYNAYNNNGKAMGSYVHNPKTTAIDFTCQADVAAPVYSNGIKNDYSTSGVGTANGGSIYYSPIADNATTFASFNIGNTDVTRNLLVYTSKNDEEQLYDNYDVVNRALTYNENTAESLIKGHQVIIGDSKKEAQYLHLVERATESAPNNDFCSPIAFDVTDRAWYTRQPANYANDANSAWEGICLPFTVDKTMASINGEITHFYGTAPDNTEPADNFYNLHHEYWLRGLTTVTSDDAKTEGKFLRPGSDLFAPAKQATVPSYVYDNDFFVKTYDSRNYNSDDNNWYSNSHTYTNYLPLTQGIPYIVSFPGNRFYEFDLSSEFYKVIDSSAKPQTVTFNAYHDNGDVVIPVTTEIKTDVTDYAHIGTYLSMADATYGMNATGTAFDKSVNTVLPFRTYMTAPPSSAKTRAGHDDSVIYIAGDATGIEEILEESFYPEDPNASSSDYLKITSIGNGRISIESTYATTLRVFTAAGQLYRLLDVRPGTETYSGFQTSIYLFGNKKVYIR